MFEAKSVVITGGASGIGAALARAFVAAGAKVCIADLDAARTGAVAEQIGALTVPCDVRSEADIQALIETARTANGDIDIFCSNAGLARGEPEHAASASNDDWELNWQVHVMAHVYAARALLPDMIARKSGHLVQVASAAGLLSQIGDAAYSATKHAAVSFAQSLAITHMDDGIDVSVVCPQYVATPLLSMDDNTAVSGSLISADQVAHTVLDGLIEKKFLILPHAQVADHVQQKAADPERWIAGMRGLRRKFLSQSATGDLKDFHKFI